MKMSVNGAAGPPSLVTLANPPIATSAGSSLPVSPQQSQPLPINGSGLWDIPGSQGVTAGGQAGGGAGAEPPMSLTSLTRLNSMECWDYTIELECLRGPEDLQLAAELGKTLLERNKELESALKHHQNIIEDQAQEIEYLTKQNGALREVNDSRMKIYEQLEVSIQDLERDKYKLALDNQAEKKHVKTLCRTIETLEAKVEELTKTMEDVRRQLDAERKKNERLQSDSLSGSGLANSKVQLRPVRSDGDGDDASLSGPDEDEITEIDTSKPENFSFAFRDQSHSTDVTDGSHGGHSFSHHQLHQHQLTDLNLAEENEELIRIMHELEKTRKCFVAEQNRVAELEEQLAAIAQENQILQSKIVQINTTEEMKSVHEELSILEEVRQGQMCTRCLRGFEDRPDDESIITGTDADDDRSLMDLIQNADVPQVYRSSVTIKTSSPKPDTLDISGTSSNNPYRELVAKYEALLEVQRNSLMRKASTTGTGANGPVPTAPQANQNNPTPATVGEELGSGDFSSLNTKFTDEDGNSKKDDQSSNGGTRRKIGLRTPTDFSEAETTSSGFSDEISNKATQTDERPRNFLCTIADGEDCKFSIYEDQTVIDSRFRFSPSHRELFREIFGILKKAADNRDEGDQLPLLDDQNPAVAANGGGKTAPKVPPVTPANEEPPSEFGDDTQSVISSAVSEQSFAMSECITKSERKKIEKQNKYAEKHGAGGEQENKPPVGVAALPDGRILTPYKRQPLDYLTVAVGVNKKKSRRRRNRGSGGADSPMERSDSPVSATPSSPRAYGSAGKKGRTLYRPWNPNAPQLTSPAAPGTAVVSTSSPNGTATAEWNGTSMTIYNRSLNSPTSSTQQLRTPASGQSGASSASPAGANPAGRPANHNRFADLVDESGEIVQFRPSPASHDLHKLKKLDLSYAEVLRRADHCKQHAQRQRHHHHK